MQEEPRRAPHGRSPSPQVCLPAVRWGAVPAAAAHPPPEPSRLLPLQQATISARKSGVLQAVGLRIVQRCC
eukprot:1159044-Pelagomonas_calceolata.AAC.2